MIFLFFFFNDTATTEIYTLSLHDALPISPCERRSRKESPDDERARSVRCVAHRSEEHTSELQSHSDLVCRLLLEKKKKKAGAQAQRGAVSHTPRRSASALARLPACVATPA